MPCWVSLGERRGVQDALLRTLALHLALHPGPHLLGSGSAFSACFFAFFAFFAACYFSWFRLSCVPWRVFLWSFLPSVSCPSLARLLRYLLRAHACLEFGWGLAVYVRWRSFGRVSKAHTCVALLPSPPLPGWCNLSLLFALRGAIQPPRC